MIKFDKSTKQIQINRGDSTTLRISAKDNTGAAYEFKTGEQVKLLITERKNVENVVLEKNVEVLTDTYTVDIPLLSEDTKIGEYINKPVIYWYEISVVSTGGEAQTIIGYDEDGAKEFVLNPEAGE